MADENMETSQLLEQMQQYISYLMKPGACQPHLDGREPTTDRPHSRARKCIIFTNTRPGVEDQTKEARTVA